MKGSLYICILYIIVPNLLFGQSFKLINNKEDKINILFSFSEKPYIIKEINGEKHIDFNQLYSVVNQSKGSPCLPLFSQSVIIPNRGKTSVNIKYGPYTEYNNINILPCSDQKKRDTIVSINKNETYSKNEFYPTQALFHSSIYILREIRAQLITLSPYTYNPVTKILRVYNQLEITINIANGIGDNELNKPINSNLGGQEFSHHFINSTKNNKYLQKEEIGELLILTSFENKNAATKLANWKNQKGIKTTIALTDTIGNSTASIKQFLVNYLNSNNNFLYLTIIGNHKEIPSYSYGFFDNEDYWSDSYYAQLLGNDLYPDIFIGRITGTNNEINTSIDKIINYDKGQSNGDWMSNAIGIGSNEGLGEGDDSEADWQHLRNIKQTLLNTNYNLIYEFYDGTHGGGDADENPKTSDVIEAINKGVGLVNYTGHGSINALFTSGITLNDIRNISNVNKTPFIISVACNHGSYTYEKCIAEQFMVGNTDIPNTGAIAFCGSSILMDWAPPMQTQDEISELINNSTKTKTTLGGLFWNGQLSMLEKYGEAGEGVMQTWIFFGDPSTEFRYQETKNTEFKASYQELNNSIQIAITSPIENLRIGISFENKFITTGKITNGKYLVEISNDFNTDSILITATKQNHETQSLYLKNNILSPTKLSNEINIYPNPSNEKLYINGININEIEILTIEGKNITHLFPESIEDKLFIDTSEFEDGVYIIKVNNNFNTIIKSITISH
jgi:gingipain R